MGTFLHVLTTFPDLQPSETHLRCSLFCHIQLIHVDFVQNSSVLCVSFRKILPHVFVHFLKLGQWQMCRLNNSKHTLQLNHPGSPYCSIGVRPKYPNSPLLNSGYKSYMREQRNWKSPKPCLHKKFLKRKRAQGHWKTRRMDKQQRSSCKIKVLASQTV